MEKLPPTILMGDVVGSRNLTSTAVQASLKDTVTAINATFTNAAFTKRSEFRYTDETTRGICILSPLTITLGDEFQGVVSDLAAAVQILFAFEENRLRAKLPLALHFVTYVGPIDTELNEEIAYGMLGPGLTHARSLLAEKGRGRQQYTFGSLLPDDSTPTRHGAPLTQTVPADRPSPQAATFLLNEEPGHPHDRRTLVPPSAYSRLRFQLRQLTGIFAMLERLTSHWKPKDFLLIADMITHPDDDACVGELHGKNRSQIWKRRKTLRIDDFSTLKGLATEITAPTAR